MSEVRVSSGDRLDRDRLYQILALRAEVFVVEQASAYLDPDGLDLLSSTLHLWLADEVGLTGYLRLVRVTDGWRIGRVCTPRRARGQGLGTVLMRAALERTGDQPVGMHAQTSAVAFYQRLGFSPVGAAFDEDGVEHIELRRSR